MHRILILPILAILLSCSAQSESDNQEPSINQETVSEEQNIFAELMSENTKVKPEDVEVDQMNGYYFGKLKSEDNFSMCIPEENYSSNPKETYIKLINLTDIEQFDMFIGDSTFHVPFKDGTLHSVDFRSQDHIVTELKNFEGRLMTFRSYKKEEDAWKMISAGFYYHVEKYVHPFN